MFKNSTTIFALIEMNHPMPPSVLSIKSIDFSFSSSIFRHCRLRPLPRTQNRFESKSSRLQLYFSSSRNIAFLQIGRSLYLLNCYHFLITLVHMFPHSTYEVSTIQYSGNEDIVLVGAYQMPSKYTRIYCKNDVCVSPLIPPFFPL